MLKHVKGSDILTRTQDFEWHRRFRESRTSVHKLPAPLKTLKSFLPRKSSSLQSADEVKDSSQTELNVITKNGFQKCIDELYKRLQKCANAQGSFFDGGCVPET
ncbi:hypothetical protein TNCV_2922571 [Trichonephila clavipes]|nr:hypothetical protein TNCV_2922571 [Trichonephila clavipes]